MKISNKSIVHVEDLSLSYYEKPVIYDIDLDIYEGTICAIIGPNGAGKSTLIKGMLGFLKPLTGFTLFFDKSFREVHNRIAYVPQWESVEWNFPITVKEVVMMSDTYRLPLFRRPNKQMKEKALDALREMDMEEYSDVHISQLSGGQKQRVFIARALNQQADLYIMDEPFAGVDKKSESIIIEQFRKMRNENKTVLAVHHDMITLENYFDDIILLNKTIKGHGSYQSLFSDITPLEWMKKQ